MHPSEIVFQPLSRGAIMPIIGGSIRAISKQQPVVGGARTDGLSPIVVQTFSP